jgi:hypothetical protein
MVRLAENTTDRGFFGSFFFFLNKKMWYQLKFLIQDLLMLSSYISFIRVKEKKNIGFFTGEKLTVLYQKFNKILKKYLVGQTLHRFVVHLVKNDFVYAEDKILFIETEMFVLKKNLPACLGSMWFVTLLCRYYVFLNHYTQLPPNWAKKCSSLIRKNLHLRKTLVFWRILFRVTRIFLEEHRPARYRPTFDRYSPIYGVVKIWRERLRLTTRMRYLFLKATEPVEGPRMGKVVKEVRQSYLKKKKLGFTFHNLRRDLEKQDWFSETNLLRGKRKNNGSSGCFFEKPGGGLGWGANGSAVQKKKLSGTSFDFHRKKIQKKRFRWSTLRKVGQIFFREIEFFAWNFITKKKVSPCISHSRQIIDRARGSEYFPPENDPHGQNHPMLTKKRLSAFFGLSGKIFWGEG